MKNKLLFSLSLIALIILLTGCSKTEEVAQEQIKETREKIEEKTASMFSCVNTKFKITEACVRGNTLNLNIDNQGTEIIRSAVIDITGDKGSQLITNNELIDAFEFKTLNLNYDSSMVGTPNNVKVSLKGCNNFEESDIIPC